MRKLFSDSTSFRTLGARPLVALGVLLAVLLVAFPATAGTPVDGVWMIDTLGVTPTPIAVADPNWSCTPVVQDLTIANGVGWMTDCSPNNAVYQCNAVAVDGYGTEPPLASGTMEVQGKCAGASGSADTGQFPLNDADTASSAMPLVPGTTPLHCEVIIRGTTAEHFWGHCYLASLTPLNCEPTHVCADQKRA
jgi:hypothetical protein